MKKTYIKPETVNVVLNLSVAVLQEPTIGVDSQGMEQGDDDAKQNTPWDEDSDEGSTWKGSSSLWED